MKAADWMMAALGLIVGGALLELPGALMGACLGYLLSTTARLKREVAELRQRLAPIVEPAAAPVAEHPAEPIAESAPELAMAPPSPADVADADAVPPATAPPSPQPAPPLWLARMLGWLRGGNLPVRLGVVILFFGVAFLLRFAAEHALLPIELRLAAVAAGGVALLGLGWRLRARSAAYGLALQGGGVGVLYLTVFAALRLYQLLPAELAFALLVALTAASSALAVLQNSPTLALMSAAGGFLAPVLASTGSGSHVLLFGYYAVLNAAILGIAYFKAWRALNLLGFGFTFVIGGAWGARYYQPEHFASTEPFLLLFFAMYLAVAVLFALRQPPRLKGYIDAALAFGVPIAVFGLQAALVRDIDFGLAWSAIGFAAVYLVLARWLWRRGGELRPLTEAFLALGVVFASLAVPLALEGRWTAVAWALEGAALVWVGVRQQRLPARLFGLALQLGSGLAAAWSLLFGSAPGLPVVNAGFLAAMSIALGALFSAWYLQRHHAALRAWERGLHWLPFAWGLAWWYGGLWREAAQRLHDDWLAQTLVLLIAASAALAAWLDRPLRWPALRLPALAALPLLGAALLLEFAVGFEHPFQALGWLAWPAAFGAGLWALWRLEAELPTALARLWHAGELWRLTFLLSWLCAVTLDRLVQGAGTWAWIGWALVPALALLLLGRPGPWRHWPLTRWREAYLTWGAGPLAAALLLWSAGANLGSRGDPWPLPYLPLLNPLDLAQLFALLAGLRWWRQAAPLLPSLGALPAGLLGAAAFLWITAVLARSVHHWGDVPFTAHALFDSVLFQASLSLLWGALAVLAMALANRFGRRPLWFAGAALMTVVVIKLFLVDLDNSGTLARIVSFLGVGALLLVIGYFAPLPPGLSKDDER